MIARSSTQAFRIVSELESKIKEGVEEYLALKNSRPVTAAMIGREITELRCKLTEAKLVFQAQRLIL